MPDPNRRPRSAAAAFAAAGAILLAVGLLAAGAALAQDTDPRRRTSPGDGLKNNVPQVYALTGATVVVRPGETIDNATLVVRDGKIESVGADGAVPDDAAEIDAKGKTIYAGFIDAFAELPSERSSLDPALAEGNSAANYWNANVIPQVAADRVLQINGGQHDALRKAGFVARIYAPDAGILRGTAALVTTAEGADGKTAVLKSDVGMVAELTVSRSARLDTYPRSPMGAVALARQAMYDADWYDKATRAVEDEPSLPRPERSDALAALQPVLKGELPLWIETGDELYALRADRFGDEFGVPVVIVGSGYEYRRLDLIAETERPLILSMNFPSPPDVTTPATADAADLDDLMHWDLAPSTPGMAVDKGMTVAMSLNGMRRVDAEFAKNLKKAIQRGLSPDDALAALTVNAAELADASDQLGTVEAGKNASFVVADGDLFDPEGKAKVIETWADGRRHVISRDPVFDFQRKWEIDGSTFSIVERGPRLTGTWTPAAAADDSATTQPSTQPATQPTKPEQYTLKNVRTSYDSASFTVDAKAFGATGVAVLSLTNVGDDTLRGTVLLPDGTRQRITASLKADEPDKPTTRPGDEGDGEIDAEVPMADADDREAADDVPTEDEYTEQEPGTATVADTTKDDEGGETTIETTDAEAPTTVAAADKKDEPLFGVNYPLGAFGRDTPDVPEAKTVVFRNATIWTSGDAGKIENGTVIVRDGKIVAVGPDDEVDVDGEFEVIDATGKHISPGIIDCHTHIATDGGINEGSQSVTCEVRIGDFVDPDDIDLYRQLAGGVTSANILHGSANPIGGQNQVIKFRWGQGPEALKFEGAPEGVKFALGENVVRSQSRYPNSRMGVAELIADSFRAAQDYRRARESYDANGGLPVRRDLELDALVEMLDGDRLIHTHSYRQDEILATLRVLEQFDVQMASLQHILEGYKVAKEIADHGAGASTFSDWWAYKFEVKDAIPYNGAIMHRAGVVVSFNSDDGELARRLNTEAAKAVKYGGVNPSEALKFVTLNPAIQLGIDDRVGSLEAGKDADLVIWSGSPLSSFSVAEQTWVDGRKYFDREEDEQLKTKVREMRAGLIQRILNGGEDPAAPGEGPTRPGDEWADVDIYCHGFHGTHEDRGEEHDHE